MTHLQLGIDDLWGVLVGLSTGPFLELWKKGRVTRMGAQDFENHMLAKTMLGLGSRNFESCNHVTIDTLIITKGMPCSRSYANLKTVPSQLKSQRYIDQSNMPPLENRETRLN